MIKIKFKQLLEKILLFLRTRSKIGGLEISDTILRFTYFNGLEWKLFGLRLPYGVIENGQIKNYDTFVDALKIFHRNIAFQLKIKGQINAVVVLSSSSVYTQVFSLPLLEGKNLEKAIQLNIQMIAPVEISKTYAGWQVINRDKENSRVEVLSVFINREVVEEFSRALKEAGFLAVSLESRALALTRTIRELSFNFELLKPCLIVNLDASGLDVLIMRNGRLYFEYFTSLRDIQGEKKQISRQLLENVIVKNIYQVINFYSSHWKDAISRVFVITPGAEEEIINQIKENFALTVETVKLRINQPINSSWFVVLGSGIRAKIPHHQDKEITLLGVSSQAEFHTKQMFDFFAFWRTLIPIVLGFLLIILLLGNLFLGRIKRSLESQPALNIAENQVKEIEQLEQEAQEFNQSLSFIQTLQNNTVPLSDFLEKVAEIAKTNEIVLNRFYFQSYEAPILLSAEAKSNEQILNFKKDLESSGIFAVVDLPFNSIQGGPTAYSFIVNLTIASSNSPKIK